MVSRENRVIAGALVLFVAVLAGLIALEMAVGFGFDNQPLVWFVLIVGFAIWVPQVVLALDPEADEIGRRTRIRFAVIATLVLAFVLGDVSGDPQERAIVLVGALAFVFLIGVEVVVGYRIASREGTP